jgi:hypothetical protein
MKHFYRSHLSPARVLETGDEFFPALGVAQLSTAPRSRTFSGTLGTMRLTVRAEGGHYTFVDVVTDQMGESRLDRNVKRFFVTLHRTEDPTHLLEASY